MEIWEMEKWKNGKWENGKMNFLWDFGKWEFFGFFGFFEKWEMGFFWNIFCGIVYFLEMEKWRIKKKNFQISRVGK